MVVLTTFGHSVAVRIVTECIHYMNCVIVI